MKTKMHRIPVSVIIYTDYEPSIDFFTITQNMLYYYEICFYLYTPYEQPSVMLLKCYEIFGRYVLIIIVGSKHDRWP